MVTDRLNELKAEQERQARDKQKRLTAEAEQQRKQNHTKRIRLAQLQVQRFNKEETIRKVRLRKGIRGLFDRITGKRKRTLEQNNQEALQAQARDKREQQLLNIKEQNARRITQQKAAAARKELGNVTRELKDDIQQIKTTVEQSQDQDREAFKAKRRSQSQRPRRGRSKARDGPEFGM